MSLLPFWNNDIVLILLLLTIVLAVACVAAAVARRSAALRNSILLPTLFITFAIPLTPVSARVVGFSIKIPLLDNRLTGSPPVAEPRETFLSTVRQDSHSTSLDRGLTEQRDTTHAAHALRNGSALVLMNQIWGLAIGIWVAGTFTGLVGLSISYVSLRKLLANARPVDHDLVAAATEQARLNAGLAVYPSIRISDRIVSPVAIGSPRRGWVLLPEGSFDRMTSDQLTQVLTHEGAHIAHRDFALRIVQRICAALWWWHPLVHILNRQLSHTREALCDNVVLCTFDPVVYGETLLAFGRLAMGARAPALAVGLFPGHERLEQRIRSLFDPRRSTMNRSRPITILVAFVVSVTTTVLAGATQLTDSARPAHERFATGSQANAERNDDRTLIRETTLSFEDRTKPGLLDVDIKRGIIRVSVHDEDFVHVRLTVPNYWPSAEPGDDGLRTVQATPLDFDVRESANTIELDTSSNRFVTNLEILVPPRTDLTLSTYMDGAVEVIGVSGTIDVHSQHNDVTLTDIAGTANVFGYNGDFVASFTKVTGDISFESYNGLVDVTLPEEVRMTTAVRTARGEMRTDFTILDRVDVSQGTKFHEEYVIGEINGGGNLCRLETTNGDILLRTRS